jgi:hypothetical protein
VSSAVRLFQHGFIDCGESARELSSGAAAANLSPPATGFRHMSQKYENGDMSA